MKKKLLVVILAFVVLIGAHAAFWFSQKAKIQASVELFVSTFAKELFKGTTDFSHSGLVVTGYPFNFTVSILSPKLVNTENTKNMEISALDASSGNVGDGAKLVVRTNLFGSKYFIYLPMKLDIKNSSPNTNSHYGIEFSSDVAPRLDMVFSKNIASLDTVKLSEFVDNNLKLLSYNDFGYVVTDNISGSKMASSESNSFDIVRSFAGNILNSSYKAKFSKLNYTEFYKSQDNGNMLWPVSLDLDFATSDQRDDSGKTSNFIIKIGSAELVATSFGVIVKGDVNASGEDIFPFGSLSIKLGNYEAMLAYSGSVLTSMFSGNSLPFFNVLFNNKIDFKKVLAEVAVEKSNLDKDILITLSREKGKNLFVGNKTLTEFIDLIKASNGNDATDSNMQGNAKDVLPGGGSVGGDNIDSVGDHGTDKIPSPDSPVKGTEDGKVLP